jgi:hypothetical protein
MAPQDKPPPELLVFAITAMWTVLIGNFLTRKRLENSYTRLVDLLDDLLFQSVKGDQRKQK